MNEVKTKPKKLTHGQTHTAEYTEYVITEEVTLNDVVRWMMDQLHGDKADIIALIEGMED